MRKDKYIAPLFVMWRDSNNWIAYNTNMNCCMRMLWVVPTCRWMMQNHRGGRWLPRRCTTIWWPGAKIARRQGRARLRWVTDWAPHRSCMCVYSRGKTFLLRLMQPTRRLSYRKCKAVCPALYRGTNWCRMDRRLRWPGKTPFSTQFLKADKLRCCSSSKLAVLR